MTEKDKGEESFKKKDDSKTEPEKISAVDSVKKISPKIRNPI
jgi:hypothetical protein